MIPNANFNQVRKIRETRKELNVVITGGSRGLGRHLAEQFVKKQHRVVTISRNPPEVNVPWKHVIADISSRNQLSHAFDDTMYLCDDHIDIWINNAALSGGYKSFVDVEENDIYNIVGTNLTAPIVFTKHAFGIMDLQKSGGDVINIVGAGSNGKETPNFALYGATKAAIKQLSKSLHKEMEFNKVSLHMLSPGMMKTELLNQNLPMNIKNLISPFVSEPEDVAEKLVVDILETYYEMPYKQQQMEYMTFIKMISNLFKHVLTF